MKKPNFITAIGTPLSDDQSLHEKGLEAHLAEQIGAGIDGILAAGTMGLMQLQADATYQQLARRCAEIAGGKMEVLIGAGDASFARTRDRIAFLNTLKIDGVALLAPYFVTFTQDELIDYFRALADFSKAPIYLYDLPQRTRCKLETPTVLELSKHPNIRGIKCSDELGGTRQLADVVPAAFRVIVAQPDLVDLTLRHGLNEQLDGMWALAPRWAKAIGQAVTAGEWEAAAAHQRELSALKRLIVQRGVFASMTCILNARGVSGSFAPRPYRLLSAEQQRLLLAEPIVQKLLEKR